MDEKISLPTSTGTSFTGTVFSVPAMSVVSISSIETDSDSNRVLSSSSCDRKILNLSIPASTVAEFEFSGLKGTAQEINNPSVISTGSKSAVCLTNNNIHVESAYVAEVEETVQSPVSIVSNNAASNSNLNNNILSKSSCDSQILAKNSPPSAMSTNVDTCFEKASSDQKKVKATTSAINSDEYSDMDHLKPFPKWWVSSDSSDDEKKPDFRKCPKCEKEFDVKDLAGKRDFEWHLQMDEFNEQQALKCEKCDMTFKKKSVRDLHVKECHRQSKDVAVTPEKLALKKKKTGKPPSVDRIKKKKIISSAGVKVEKVKIRKLAEKRKIGKDVKLTVTNVKKSKLTAKSLRKNKKIAAKKTKAPEKQEL